VGGVLTDAGLYAADIVFDGSGNVVGLAAQPAAPLVSGSTITVNNGQLRPSIAEHDWSPDGTNVVFATTSDTPALRKLYIANPALGGAPVPLATSRPASDPSWSPNGAKIAFQASEFGGDLYTISINGSGEKQIAKTHSGQQNGFFPPHWSQDGQYIIYGTWGSVLGDARADILRVKADGSGKLNLTADIDTRQLSSGGASAIGWR
jgi:Tol biopolymer transport system component